MLLPTAAVPKLDEWAANLRNGSTTALPNWRAEGPGRQPVDALPMNDWLREHAVSGESFTFNALHREKQGGRSYPFFLPHYEDALTISENKYGQAKKDGPRMLLAAVWSDVRDLIELPAGWQLLELDFKSCHAAIGVALSGCATLAADVARDIHQVVGDAVFHEEPDPEKRRGLGKRMNNSMFFGLSSSGLHKLVCEVVDRKPTRKKVNAVWSSWWDHYAGLRDYRDEVKALVKQAQVVGDGIEFESPSGWKSKFDKREVRGKSFNGQPDRPLQRVWPSIFSAAFRSVEGDLLNETLRNFHANNAGGRPVLPLYDGMLVAAPTGAEDAVSRALVDAGDRAAETLGVEAVQATVKRKPKR